MGYASKIGLPASILAIYASVVGVYCYVEDVAQKLLLPGIQVLVATATVALAVIVLARFTGSLLLPLTSIIGAYRVLDVVMGKAVVEIIILPLAALAVYGIWRREQAVIDSVQTKITTCNCGFEPFIGATAGVLLGITLTRLLPPSVSPDVTLVEPLTGFLLGSMSRCQLWKPPLYAALSTLNVAFAPLVTADLLTSPVRMAGCRGVDIGVIRGVLLRGFTGDALGGSPLPEGRTVGWHWVKVIGSPLTLEVEGSSNLHTVVLGKSGSGKSSFTRTLVSKFSDTGFNVFIFDFHGEYNGRGWIRLVIGENAGIDVCSLGDSEWSSLLLGDSFRSVFRLGPIQYNMITRALREALVESCGDDTTDFLVAVRRALRVGVEEYGVGDQKSLQSLLLYLDEVGPLFKASGVRLTGSEGRVVVFDFSRIPSRRAKVVATEILFRVLFDAAVRGGLGKSILVVEEAHMLPEDTFLGKVYAEGRKFGLAALAISQHPSSVPREVIGNASWKFVFAIDEPTELSYVSRLVAGSDDEKRSIVEETIAGLETGKAVVRGPHCGVVGVYLVESSG